MSNKDNKERDELNDFISDTKKMIGESERRYWQDNLLHRYYEKYKLLFTFVIIAGLSWVILNVEVNNSKGAIESGIKLWQVVAIVVVSIIVLLKTDFRRSSIALDEFGTGDKIWSSIERYGVPIVATFVLSLFAYAFGGVTVFKTGWGLFSLPTFTLWAGVFMGVSIGYKLRR